MTEPGNHSNPRPNLVAIAVASALAVCSAREGAYAAQLPIPCGGTACGPNNPTWLAGGKATLAQGGNTLTVTQTTPSATLNWRSFNISADGKVNFVQPSSSAVAVNQIFQGSASQIFGALNSNGVVYLLNQNGILFGTGSVVNVGGLLASSLNLSPAAVANGIGGATVSGSSANAALQPYDNEMVNTGSVTVQSGASITANQGQILLFAPTVTNSGTLSSPSGQTILGAGQKIFLTASDDPNIRGLFIEVSGCADASVAQCTPTVTNTGGPGQPVGQIIANTGNVTLAGLAVQQNGRISATTSVRSNGSIRLQARTTDAADNTTGFSGLPTKTGTVSLGDSSVTSIALEGGPEDKTVDVNAQPKSLVQLIGGEIDVLDHAAVSAPSGTVTLTALTDPTPAALPTLRASQPDTSRIYLAPSSSIDVSGVTVSEPVSDNSLAVQLRGSETEDFPQQRAGPLRGQTVYVDIRQHGTRADGSTWVGTPIADLAGDVSAIQRDVFQRNLTGGNIEFSTGGSLILSPGAVLNVSGGQINWQAGYVKSSVLAAPNGKLTPIGQGDPNTAYLGTLDTISQGDPHWGTVANVTLPGYSPQGVYQPAYVEGKDAGSISITAPAFVLDGSITARTVTGPLQRIPTDLSFPQDSYYQGMLYRFPDQVPLGGTLTLGNSRMLDLSNQERAVLENLTFSSGTVLPTLTGPGGGDFDPLRDPLPEGFVSSLRPDLFGSGNLRQLNVYADGDITVPASVSLAPGPGGSVTLAAGQVDFAGRVVSNGGSVSLESIPTVLVGGSAAGAPADSPGSSLVLAPTAVIDLRGAWVNDPLATGQNQFAPLFTSGGSASLFAAQGGLLSIASDARIDVSGGAQRTLTRSIVPGSGGRIAIAAGPTTLSDNPTQVDLPADLSPVLSAYALNDGGKLSLTLPSLCISSAACLDPNAYRVDPNVLTNLGFESVTLAAQPSSSGGGLVVAADVDVLVRQQNLAFLPGALNLASANTLAGLTQVATLPDYLRHAENLTLSGDADNPGNYTSLQFADVSISAGSVLQFDPGASVNLATNSRIFLNGALRAPAGMVALTIRNNLIEGGGVLVPNQGIWLGSDSVIDVRGTTVTSPSSSGLLLGNVLSGGGVTVDAERGYVIGAPGSQILAGGTSGTLDLHPPGTNVYTRQTVASPGGAVSLLAAEGIQYDGAVSAPAGGTGVAGGSLTLALDGTNARNGASGGGFPAAALAAPRVLTVTASDDPTVIGEGVSIPLFLDGLGRISAGQIDSGGFGNVTLTARELLVADQNGQLLPPVHGVVAFQGGVSVAATESLLVDASEIRGIGSGAVQLASSYVRLGSSDTLSPQVPDAAAAAGTATLAVQAHLIDLLGDATLSGFGPAMLASSGDIRLTGVQVQGNPLNGFVGSFVSPGPLTLTAQQIYPTTLSNFTVQVTASDPTQSILTINAAPGTPSEVLSAAGNVTLAAAQIVDAGLIRAPIGTISLQAQSVILKSGAVLSVSAAGTTIPFGQTQGGFDWSYPLNPAAGAVTVYGTGTGDTTLPAKQIIVTADTFQLQPGATLDTSGSGDLLAYEWIPGLGGTKDVLSPAQSPGLFAVVPGMNLPFAPIDPNEDHGFLPPVGSSVYLSAGGGLPAGTYALLPPRYALLPGAYLVKAVSGYSDLTAGQTVAQLDGSTIVSGYRVNAGTGLRDARSSGFDVVSGSHALDSTNSSYTLAQYNLTTANSFFANQAKVNNVATPRLPADAGSVALNLTNGAQLQGTLLATAPSGYRGGTFDITATDLLVTSQPTTAPAGTVVLDVNQLNQLGAESLLLGATRSSSGNYTQLNVLQGGSGNTVEIDSGAVLKAPEVILAASNVVQLDSGAAITAAGTVTSAEPDLIAPPGTAVLRVATGAQVALNPTTAAAAVDALGAGLAGSIKVAAGASISAPGSVSVDAGSAVDFSGALSASGAAVRLGGSQLALGAAPADFAGFVIGPSLLTGLTGADLTLEVNNSTTPDYSTRAVQVYGPVQLGLSSLTVDAPGLVAATPDGVLTITAQKVTLGSGTAQQYAPGAGGSAALSIDATHVSLADGTFASGFATTSITAGQDLTVAGTGTLGAAGALSINSPIIQSASGQTYQIIAGGDLVTATPAGATSGLTSVAGPGGAISFTGAGVTLGGNVVLPAGRIAATATSGALNVISGATLDVSGFSRDFDGEVRSAAGGTVQLVASNSDVTVAPGSVIDVSAGSGGAGGGTFAVDAPTGTAALGGTLRGAGAPGTLGGSLSVEAQKLDFAGLVAKAGTAGFTGVVSLHQRGAGDFALASGTLQAQDVELTADQGAINIGSGATIDARADDGGKIVLAGQTIDLAGSLLAGSTTHTDRGGTVELLSSGSLLLDPGSVISVGGAGNSKTAASAGTVWLRAPQSVVASVAGPGPTQLVLASNVSGAGNVYLEAYNSYGIAGTSIDPTNDPTTMAQWSATASDFMSNVAPAVLTSLTSGPSQSVASLPAFSILPGIEVDAPGDLHVSSAWDLSQYRFGDGTVPGVLTVRTGGSLYVDSSISDGFNGLSSTLGPTARSWSYRLAAGADLNSSNPLSVASDPNAGSLILAPGQPPTGTPGRAGNAGSQVMIRTGTGSIELAAAGDLRLGNQASVIYTAGTAGPGKPVVDSTLDGAFLGQLAMPLGGGDVTVTVGRDVVGAPSNQLFNDWLWRGGRNASAARGYLPTSWAPAYAWFNQGVGALGGGDLTIRAGGDIRDLGAVVPSTGVPVGTGSSAIAVEQNAGMLRVVSGGDILGGKFLDMAGDAIVDAGGTVRTGTPQKGADTGLNLILGLGSGTFDVTARSDLTLEAAFETTMVPRASTQLQNVGGTGRAFSSTIFSTYTDASGLTLQASGGTLTYTNRVDQIDASSLNLSSILVTNEPEMRVLPPNFAAVALGGDVALLNNGIGLWPAPHGNLDLLAVGSVSLTDAPIIVSDADPASLPTVNSVSANSNDAQIAAVLARLDTPATTNPAGPGLHAPQPLHGGAFASDGQPDSVPVRIVALTGDLTQTSTSLGSAFFIDVPKPIDVVAGGNIVNLQLNVQQLSSGNISSITAGGDITYPSERNELGALVANTSGINVAGPGQLQIQAGGTINLGTSNGISSLGNIYNAALPASGANIGVAAGITQTPHYQDFINAYLVKGSTYDQALEQFVAAVTGQQNPDKQDALALFEGMTTAQQAALIETILFDELRAGGRSAAAAGPGHNDFTRAFAALTTLYPDSAKDRSNGATVPYVGDLLLYFSRIYTLAGGDIDLLAPGGQVNVGLAVPPTSFGITKGAAQLGIVAQSTGSENILAYSDVQVNQSRVFAADGGDILMWSTFGNIDAGRGAKTAISAPPPIVTIDPTTGAVKETFPAALLGSGIQALATSTGVKPGAVDLFAPNGVVNANDAGIVAGDLTIAATAVLGANNISVSGTAVGLPPPALALGALTASASSSSSAASGTAQNNATESTSGKGGQTSKSQAALNWLEVFVLGLGEGDCKPDDIECIKRQQKL